MIDRSDPQYAALLRLFLHGMNNHLACVPVRDRLYSYLSGLLEEQGDLARQVENLDDGLVAVAEDADGHLAVYVCRDALSLAEKLPDMRRPVVFAVTGGVLMDDCFSPADWMGPETVQDLARLLLGDGAPGCRAAGEGRPSQPDGQEPPAVQPAAPPNMAPPAVSDDPSGEGRQELERIADDRFMQELADNMSDDLHHPDGAPPDTNPPDEESLAKKAALFGRLRDLGLATLDVEYNGNSDVGYVEVITGVKADGTTVEPDDALRELVEEYVCDRLPGGWEIDDGSFGTAEFDVAAGVVEYTHSTRFIDYSIEVWEE